MESIARRRAYKGITYNGHGQGNRYGISSGYYQFFYNAVYHLLYWTHSATGFQDGSGWNSFWTYEMRLFNNDIPKSWGISFTAEKHYASGETFQSKVPELGTTTKLFNKALQMDLAWKNHRHGAVMAGVSTSGLGDGWKSYGGPWNHYVSIDGYTRNYENTGKPGVDYMDTAWNPNPQTFGDGPASGHADTALNFLNKAIEVSGKNSTNEYNSDRVIIFAGPRHD